MRTPRGWWRNLTEWKREEIRISLTGLAILLIATAIGLGVTHLSSLDQWTQTEVGTVTGRSSTSTERYELVIQHDNGETHTHNVAQSVWEECQVGVRCSAKGGKA